MKIIIPDISNLATTTTSLNVRINEVQNEIPSITNLATTTALTVAKNKIPYDSNLTKKSGYSTNIILVQLKMKILVIIIIESII